LADHRTKKLPAYGLQEPFRWIAEVAVVEAFEGRVLDLPDFCFTGDDYRYRFDPEAKQRFLALLRERFSSGVGCRDRKLNWETVIEQKTVELGRYLIGCAAKLSFSEPAPILHRSDDHELRNHVLALSTSEARKLGIPKSTTHYLRRNASNGSPFKIYKKTPVRLISVGRSRI
jgi:CRISPR-associated protein Cas1